MRKHHKVLGLIAGIILFTPIEEVFIGKVLFPRADTLQLLGLSFMVFFGFKLIGVLKNGD